MTVATTTTKTTTVIPSSDKGNAAAAVLALPNSKEAARALLKWISSQLPESAASSLLAQAQAAMDSANHAQLAHLLSKHSAQLSKLGKDMEAPYNQLFSYLPLIKEKEKVNEIITAILQPFLATGNEKTLSPESMKVLSNLYNVLDASSSLRHDVFVALLQVAQKLHMLPELIKASVGPLSAWMEEWGLSADKKRALLTSLADATGPTMPKISLQFLVDFLKTPNAGTSPQSKAIAERAVLLAIRTKNVLNFEPLVCNATLQSCLKGSPVLELFTIFHGSDSTATTVKGYRAWLSKHGGVAWLTKHGLKEEDTMHKLRLLTLAGVTHDRTSVEYGMIAEALDVSNPEGVESWIVEGIRAGLIEAKMNPLSRTVTIHRSFGRCAFGRSEWEGLASKIDEWKGHLDTLLAVMKKERDE